MDQELGRKLWDWDKDVGVTCIKVKVESGEQIKWIEERKQKTNRRSEQDKKLGAYPHLNNRKKRWQWLKDGMVYLGSFKTGIEMALCQQRQQRRVWRKTEDGLRGYSLGIRKSRVMFTKRSFSGAMWRMLRCRMVWKWMEDAKKGAAVFSRRSIVKGVNIRVFTRRVRDSKKSFCGCFKMGERKVRLWGGGGQ